MVDRRRLRLVLDNWTSHRRPVTGTGRKSRGSSAGIRWINVDSGVRGASSWRGGCVARFPRLGITFRTGDARYLPSLLTAFHGGRSGRRVALTIISAAAFLALLVSGIGYLTLMPALMSAANVSLPLLLIWALAAMAARVSEFRAPIAADTCDRNGCSSPREHNRA